MNLSYCTANKSPTGSFFTETRGDKATCEFKRSTFSNCLAFRLIAIDNSGTNKWSFLNCNIVNNEMNYLDWVTCRGSYVSCAFLDNDISEDVHESSMAVDFPDCFGNMKDVSPTESMNKLPFIGPDIGAFECLSTHTFRSPMSLINTLSAMSTKG